MLSVVGEVYEVSPDQVVRGERLRPVDPIWAGALARMFDRDGGQHTPAQVTRQDGALRLILGGHRHEAARLSGRGLKVVLVDVDELGRRSREIEDNLMRRDLHPIDRASLLDELVKVEKARAGLPEGANGRSASAAARWHGAKHMAEHVSDTMSLAFGWTDEVASQVGLNRRSIYRDLQLHQALAPDVAALLRPLPPSNNAAALRSLAKLSPVQQRRVADRLVAGAAITVREAIDHVVGKVEPSSETKRMSALLGTYQRMSTRERQRALRELRRLGVPPGFEIIGGAADA